MKVVIIGGTGLIGSKVVAKLRAQGHEALPASPNSGVNTLTGEGLAEALVGAQVVVDVSNSPSFADDDVMEFFTTSTRNLLAAEAEAGVIHHLALSIVGSAGLPNSGYMRAKVAQEQLIRDGRVPFSIIHATQFFEFVRGIADQATTDGVINVSTGAVQPIAAEDVATAVARGAVAEPVGDVEIAGPEKFGMDYFVTSALTRFGDERTIIADPEALYFDTVIDEHSLVPAEDAATLYAITLEEWLSRQN